MTQARAERASAVSVVAAVMAVVVGALVLIGWLFGIAPLTQLVPGLMAMKATTAVGLVAIGLTIWLLTVTRANSFALVVAGFVLVLGVLAVEQDAGHLRLHFDPRIFYTPELPPGAGTSTMSLPASLCLTFIGAALVVASLTQTPWAFQIIALVPLVMSTGILLGHLYGIDEMSRQGSNVLMAPYSAVSMLAASIGVLWLRPFDGITGVILSDSLGGRMARKLLPAVILIPVVAGLVIRSAYRRGWYDGSLEIGLVVLTTLALLSIVIWRNARLITRLDAARRRADAALLEAQENVESTVALRTSEFLRSQQAAADQQARERVRQRMESLGQLAGSIAHDVNNMMTVVTGYGSVLLKRLPAHDPLRGPIQEIKKAGDRCSALTRQLLAFGRRQILVPAVVDPGEMIADLQTMLPMIVGEDVTVEYERPHDVWAVRIDPTQIEQVIVNMAVNAREAMPGGGSLRLGTDNVTVRAGDGLTADVPPGEYVRITVTDTGAGMDAETLSRVFEPFFTTKPAARGGGLGLSTAYGIVRQSGGHITVQSELGAGTTFSIFLPRVEAPIAAVLPPVDSPAGVETVLLVEDDESVRDLLKFVLEQAGYWVLSAASGEEAIAVAAQHRGVVDIVVTDVVMPGLRGPEVVARLREAHPDLRALLMSGYPKDELPDLSLTPGAEFMQKPVTPEAFLTCVRQLLDRA